MAYTTNQLVTNAYYIAGIVSRDFEQPTGQQLSDGLSILNDLIADKTIDSSLIPYTDNYTFDADINVAQYFIPDLIYIETFVFYINSVRYQTNNQQRKEFFGTFRAENIQSLPFNWHTERCFGGANLFLYFRPDQEYPMEIWGQFRLSSVTQFQDLSLTLDRFYINFLKYELAVRLCKEYAYSVPVEVKEQLDEYYQVIGGKSNTMDLRTNKLSSLSRGGAINYAFINLAGGWVPLGFGG